MLVYLCLIAAKIVLKAEALLDGNGMNWEREREGVNDHKTGLKVKK